MMSCLFIVFSKIILITWKSMGPTSTSMCINYVHYSTSGCYLRLATYIWAWRQNSMNQIWLTFYLLCLSPPQNLLRLLKSQRLMTSQPTVCWSSGMSQTTMAAPSWDTGWNAVRSTAPTGLVSTGEGTPVFSLAFDSKVSISIGRFVWRYVWAYFRENLFAVLSYSPASWSTEISSLTLSWTLKVFWRGWLTSSGWRLKTRLAPDSSVSPLTPRQLRPRSVRKLV